MKWMDWMLMTNETCALNEMTNYITVDSYHNLRNTFLFNVGLLENLELK